MNHTDITHSFGTDDIDENRIMAMLSYISILVIIPVVAARESPYAMFHANQGIVLAVVEIISGAALSIFGWIPIIGLLLKIALGALGFGCLALSIMGVINCLNGKAVKLPVIGDISVLR